MTLWVIWKKPIEPLIELDPEDAKNAQELDDGITVDNYIGVEMPFNSLMTEFFQGSNINDLIQRMLAHIKTQVENPRMPENGFSLDKIMHLYINFHGLALIRGSSYIGLPEWLKSKKAVINPQNKDEASFKWAVIEALHHEDIKHHPERISLLRPYENQYNWKGLEFPVSIKKIDKFEKNNPGIAVNMLFSKKKSQNIYTVRRSKHNLKCKKQINLLMIEDGEKRHYNAIKSISRLLKSLNATHKGVYHFCMNCLNGFWTASARDKHYEYCISNGHVKVNMPTEEEKWLKFHDGQYQFKVPFMMYADFESILKPVDERYKEKMNRMKAERNGKAPYTEKINTHVPSGWCVHSTFAYGDVPNPLKMYRGKDFVEKFVEYIEEEVKRLYATFPRQPMTELTDVLKREHKAVEKCHICLKEFNDPKNKKVRDHCHYTNLYRGAAHNNCNLKYRIPDHIPIVFHNLSGYDAHLFIKELGKRFKNDIGIISENKEKYISFVVKINTRLTGVRDEDGKEVHKNI